MEGMLSSLRLPWFCGCQQDQLLGPRPVPQPVAPPSPRLGSGVPGVLTHGWHRSFVSGSLVVSLVTLL